MEIVSENVRYSEDYIEAIYDYSTTLVEKSNDGKLKVSLPQPYVYSQFLFLLSNK